MDQFKDTSFLAARYGISGESQRKLIMESITIHRLYYSRKQAAEAFGVCLRSVDSMIAFKLLRPKRIGRRVLIPADQIKNFGPFAKQDRNPSARVYNRQNFGGKR